MTFENTDINSYTPVTYFFRKILKVESLQKMCSGKSDVVIGDLYDIQPVLKICPLFLLMQRRTLSLDFQSKATTLRLDGKSAKSIMHPAEKGNGAEPLKTLFSRHEVPT